MKLLLREITGIFGGLILCQLALAADAPPQVDCTLATKLAEKSYTRIQSALDSKDVESAIMYSKAFWDVFDLTPSCSNLQKISVTLNNSKLGKDIVPVRPPPGGEYKGFSSISTFDLSKFKFPEDCKDDCKIVFTSSGKGNIDTIDTPKAFFINNDKTAELKFNKSQISNDTK
ncbi:MAG: hypothetical protein JWQ69_5293 [Pseudomonas sp.]|nr:hypothetical protein [Pseudomonas sp.]